MQILLQKKTICRKIRLFFRCPECTNVVVLDYEVFNEKPTSILCEKCSIEYLVLSIGSEKRNFIELQVINKE